ncbi:hypothetical protein FWF74_00210 [Candidatus Saccharibacteria bacterium]|nr:hypothetical protein [Candidatus Saccharibacteria bacterium]
MGILSVAWSAGGAATFNGADLRTGETYETEFYMSSDSEYIRDFFVDQYLYLLGTYDCEDPVVTPPISQRENPKTGDIDVVTMIATSVLAVVMIAGSVLVIKKQRA